MASLTDFYENRLIDGLFRGGCLTTAGAAGPTTVVKGIWTATTAYALGDITVPHASMTGAGGKLLKCTTAGTSGSTNTLAVPNPGSTLVDGGVTWTAIATVPALDQHYVGLFTVAPTDSTAGTECSGGGYARVAIASTLAAWAGTQGATTTTVSTGTGGTTSNNGAITFPSPTTNWGGTIVAVGLFDQLTGGNLLVYANLTASKNVNNGDPAPSFAISALTFQVDN